MAVSKSLLLAFSSLLAYIACAQNNASNLNYVDQLIGSANGGVQPSIALSPVLTS